jgi:hypothetical protein
MYQPNRLIRNERERFLIKAASQLRDHVLLLRPSRKHLFPRGFRLPEGQHVPAFFKPCVAVLARKTDPDKRPCLALEVDDLDPDMQALYRQHGVPHALLRTEASGHTVLTYTQGPTRMTVEEPSGNLTGALAAGLALSGTAAVPSGGSYVHSYSERVLREAVEGLGSTFGVACHHQVPVGFVLGHRPDLSPDEKRLLGSDIDAVVTARFDIDPDGTVVLPVKLDLHASHTQGAVAERDRRIRDLFARSGVPLLVVTPAEDRGCRFESELLNAPVTVDRPDPEVWADALTPVLARALRQAQRA